MADLKQISEYKNKIISQFLNNDSILSALNPNDINDYVYTHIFPYEYIPETAENVTSYITMEIDVTSPRKEKWANTIIKIWIISHQNNMKIQLPKMSKTRNDYLAELVCDELNGNSNYGFKTLMLKSSTTGAFNSVWRYRSLIFEGLDANNGFCQ